MRTGGRFRCFTVLAFIPLLLSCSIRLTEPDRFPEAVRMHDVGPYLQDAEQCGPFALASLLQYMGIRADAASLARRLYSPGAGGTLTMDLFLEAGRQGLDARQLSGSPDILKKELKDYNPVIALFKYSTLQNTAGHFILVTGYSDRPAGFFLLWGDGKLSWMELKRFDQLWSGADSWMLTVRAER